MMRMRRRKKKWMLTSPRSFRSFSFNNKPRVALATRGELLNRDAKSFSTSSSSSMMKMRRRTRKMKARREKKMKK